LGACPRLDYRPFLSQFKALLNVVKSSIADTGLVEGKRHIVDSADIAAGVAGSRRTAGACSGISPRRVLELN
jgi:hypothetical protein